MRRARKGWLNMGVFMCNVVTQLQRHPKDLRRARLSSTIGHGGALTDVANGRYIMQTLIGVCIGDGPSIFHTSARLAESRRETEVEFI